MEDPPRPRKFKRASVSFEGSIKVQEKITAPKPTHNSVCRYDSTANEDMFMIELGESASEGDIVKPVKNLIAKEMLIQVEPKRKEPSVVARLMGLDDIPSPQQFTRQQRRPPESFTQRKEQREAPRTMQMFVDQAHRRNYTEHHQVNDLNEDLEASYISTRRYSSRWNTKPEHNTHMPEMAVIQHKYLEAAQLSADEKLQNSKVFLDASNELEFNDKLLLKCRPQHDSIFSKHFLDKQVDTSSSMYSRIAVLKPATSANSQGTSILGKPGRRGSGHHDMNLPRRRDNAHLLHLQHPHGGHSSFKSPKIHVKGKSERIFPTRIVVLKPNCGKTHSDVTSAQYRAEEKKPGKRLSFGAGKSGSAEIKNSSKYAHDSSFYSKEARELAKQITTRMRNSHGPSDVRKDSNLVYSDIIGYATDEISRDVYESDSSNELDMLKPCSGSLYCRTNRCKSLLTGTIESSVSKEAKQRLSERWKMSQTCQDMETASRGSTLGEMLSLPNRETESERLDAMETFDRKIGGKCTDAWEYPLGVSSRDARKDGYISSRSRSLSPLGSQIQGMSTRQEVSPNSRNLRLRVRLNGLRSMDHSRNKSWDGSQSQVEEVSFSDKRSGRKKLRSCHRKGTGANDTFQEAIFCKMMNSTTECNLSEKLHLPLAMTVSKNATSVVDLSTHTAYTDEGKASESSIDPMQKSILESNDTLFPEQDASYIQESSVLTVPSQCHLPESESSESSRDGHPSPVSVLEGLTFTEDSLSGSESLEIVSAKINDLRMKIQQLKKKSSYCDADAAADYFNDFPQSEMLIVEEEKCMEMSPSSWESSYISDVLMDSGFMETEPDAFIATSHYLDFPLSPSTFENLEKKYSFKGGTSVVISRHARRLLFDRLNLALLEILQQYVDPCPWLQRRVVDDLGCQRQPKVTDALPRLLADQASLSNSDTSERILDQEMCWLDVRVDINLIGKDVEKSIVDDLITEMLML
ncbi:unnamed protein product [Cuscuta europaea]|uniref:DUF4378 domain-containing protein n=1 Tax=Cuscuta europaea TaxID=41803 RepID=A0A9P0YM22_CUSEU|nr:unnamed protein product [Cuscuta europaea]